MAEIVDHRINTRLAEAAGTKACRHAHIAEETFGLFNGRGDTLLFASLPDAPYTLGVLQ